MAADRGHRACLGAHVGKELRELELALPSACPDDTAALLDALQAQWRERIRRDVRSLNHKLDSSKYFANASEATTFIATTRVATCYRRAYWEHQFRKRLVQHDMDHVAGAAENDDDVPLFLFSGVVHHVKVRGREMTRANVDVLLSLPSIERLELHHAQVSDDLWRLLSELIEALPALREVCLLHSKLPTVAPLLAAMARRRGRPIDVLGFSSVKMSSIALREIVAAFQRDGGTGLCRLRLNNSVTDVAGVNALVASGSRALDTLVLQFNELEDDVLEDLTEPSSRLQHVSLAHNCLTNVGPLAHCRQLLALDLSGNELGDTRASQMATDVLPHLTNLRELYLVNCAITDLGVTVLLPAITTQAHIATLNLSRNYVGPAFGTELSAFIASNAVVHTLHLSSIGLGDVPPSPLLVALASNRTLRRLSLGENRLRNQGAVAVFRALLQRAALLPFDAVDLRGNLLSDDGLQSLVAATSGRKRKASQLTWSSDAHLIDELNLQDNVFQPETVLEASQRFAPCIQHVFMSHVEPASAFAYDDEA
ncbi:hypothetical protein SPRG_00894 [Saprolegnia parasitica CBS 223.65]|uniref:Uncharacterized protein n=1 Tax=Saprolegnia parasitica (strain CBS 223.65) TaxID=695850 RepID=A0A067CWG0_SAPPC|nr:hypothetical protein SPRG_00894 [Saprolegnia parasitica CBS 223.65]KDO34833.1 hypothetical protein SPRG_00894 [Saprolegnia parasitica CBS 223.65]|eukprot:XP_012194496.1 hypothetical protein SPRG_00894 [Saprolegnia parasitica CBS 223.65]